MKKNLRYWAVAAVGAVAALGFTSCVYDPYSQSSVGASYSSGGGGGSYGGGGGFGDGYGYGGSSFSTSLFVGTGNSQWGYDPGCRSYYDYGRNCYYDPYLNGYYPRGYRPPVVYGAPHPHGWTSGRDYIRPPGRVSGGYVSDYRNRESRYRNSDYGWARQVRRGPREAEDREERSVFQGFQRSERQDARRSGRADFQESGMPPFGGGRSSSPFSQVQRQPSQRELARAYQESVPQRARQDAQRSSRFEGVERSVTREREEGGGGRQGASYDRSDESSGSESRGQRSATRAERNTEQPQSERTPARARSGRREGREEESR